MVNQRISDPTRSFQILALFGCLLLLLLSAGGAYVWLLHGQASLEGYRAPIRVQPQAAGQQTAPLAAEVMFVIIDGLRYDAAPGMPTLSLLQRQGASARVLLRPPSYSQPTWTTLVTGAWPELNGAALLNAPKEGIQPIAVDHIFAAAKRANLTTALAGSSWWARMIPADMLDLHLFVEEFDAAADQRVADGAIRITRNFDPNLTLVYFGHLDEVAHKYGARSDAYHEAALEIDGHLRDLVASLDRRRAVLIVTSDHGHIDRGGHGGGDRDVVYTPFVAIGDPVVPGEHGTIAQVDIAPTIAAILGAPIPRLSQGTPRFEMLRSDLPKRAETMLDMALQRRDMTGIYLASIGQGALSETARGDVDVATSSMEVKNLESAYGLARMAVERIDREMAQARERRILRERSLRLPLAVLVTGLPLLFLVIRRGRPGLWPLVAAIATLLAYHMVFVYQGNVYSFSGLTGLEPLVRETAERVGLASAAGGGLILWRLIRDRVGSALRIMLTSLTYSLLVIYLLGCQAALIYWLNGFHFSWYIPDMGVVFWQLAVLVQTLLFAGAGIVLPILLLLAGLAFQSGEAVQRRVRALSGGKA